MHIKMTVEYVGTKFHGFQAQNGKRTVQGELETALSRYLGAPVKVVGSGRTDAGVHAFGQVVSFLLPESADISDHGRFIYRMCGAVNKFLPLDVSVRDAEFRDKFNARSEAKAKTYIYRCYVGQQRSAVRDATHHQLYKMPNLTLLRAGAAEFVGGHDFTAFAGELGERNPNRIIYNFDIKQNGEDGIWFAVRGNGFLKNQVRIMVGTLLDIADGKLTAGVSQIMNSRDRKNAGTTAPAKGLSLHDVEY